MNPYQLNNVVSRLIEWLELNTEYMYQCGDRVSIGNVITEAIDAYMLTSEEVK